MMQSPAVARPRGKILLMGIALLVLLAVFVAGVRLWQSSGNALSNVKPVQVGAPAPDITLAQLENGAPGEKIALSSLRGHPVILNFWATWCVPCRAEFPAMDAKFREYKDSKKLLVIGVDVGGEPAADIQRFIGETGVSFPVWLDSQDAANRVYHIQALPTTFFIDRNGIVKDIKIGGPMTTDYLESELKQIF